jgi:hypothetical protein
MSSTERRSSPRHTIEGGQGRVKLRLGHEVSVVNVSDHGILIEGAARLRPGSRVELQSETPSSYLHAIIARCEVSLLDENGVTYRAGLTFAQPFSFRWLLNSDQLTTTG